MSDVHALSGAYAVDALDDLERAGFERHLAECEACRTEVDGLREAAALLAVDAATTPPTSLRGQLLAEIATIRPLPPRTGPAPIPPMSTGPTTYDGAVAADQQTAPRARWLPALVAAAVATIVGLVALGWQPWRDEAPQLSAVQRVLTAPDAEAVRLDFPDGSSAVLTRSERLRRAVLTTTEMAPPPPGKVYELWLQQPDGSMTPAGLMPARPTQSVVLDGDAAAAVGAGITVEPAGGSELPSGEPIALFDFQAAT